MFCHSDRLAVGCIYVWEAVALDAVDSLMGADVGYGQECSVDGGARITGAVDLHRWMPAICVPG